MRFPMLIPASLLLAGAAMPLPLAAQAMVQPLPGTTDADKLADLVRQIGRNPRDVRALVDAGDLSAKLGDTTAAASLYKRASQVDPNNARVQAGIARILVNGEHPGEALRYFNQAERAGLSPATFAGDRGLAFDLIGEQERAQRDYRVALSRPGQDDEDEVRRRYALSLGISGLKDVALQQIDALLRKSDRGAWRARAFILAMNGDASGANRIATTMMPLGMGAGLAAFFTRLPTLSPADRAFAVHFGEVTPTPERIADARLVPPLPALAPDPYARPAGVQVAAQAVAAPAPASRNSRRGREARERYRAGSTRAEQVAAVPAQTVPQATVTPAVSSPTQVAQATIPARPTYAPRPASSQPAAATTQVLAAAPTGTTAPLPQPSLAARPSYTPQSAAPAATLAAAAEPRTILPTPATSLASAAAQANNAISSQGAATQRATAALPSSPSASAAALADAAVRNQAPALQPAPGALPSSAASSATQAPVAFASTGAASPTVAAAAPENVTSTPSQPVQLAAASSATPSFTPPPRATAAPRGDDGDTILARIVANISIPASELGVAPMPGAAPQPGSTASIDEAALAAERNAAAIERRREREAAAVAESRTRAAAPTKAASAQTDTAAGPKDRSDEATPPKSRRASTRKEQLAQADADETPATKRRGARATDKKTEADEPKLTPRQAAAKAKADAKALADAKAAAAEKKAAAAEKKAARAEPERYWVQVAGGATQGDLAKAWKNVRAKSSLLANRAGYTTPLRATNRVVTGPFKTQDEAQAMVNKLSKDGVSAFSFTSEAGQKMTKLGGK